jgi:hypothetical protein
MSTMKTVGIMTMAGGAISGGISLYKGMQARKAMMANAEKVAKKDGRIPIGGMTKDGALWDGFTTIDKVKQDSKKAVIIGSAMSSAVGAVSTGIISGLTLLLKSHIK